MVADEPHRRPRGAARSADAGGAGVVASIFHTPAPVTRRDWIRAGVARARRPLPLPVPVRRRARADQRRQRRAADVLDADRHHAAFHDHGEGAHRRAALGRHAALASRHLHRRRARRARERRVAARRPDAGGRGGLLGALHDRGAAADGAAFAGRRDGAVDADRDAALRAAGGAATSRRVPWGDVSAITWIKLVYSSLFAICVAYTIWYAAVRAIGSARTSVYSNLLPIVAMVDGLFLAARAARCRPRSPGAAAVLAGVALTRLGHGCRPGKCPSLSMSRAEP